MTVKTTGAEFKKFYMHLSYCRGGVWRMGGKGEGDKIIIDGARVDNQIMGYNYLAIMDSASVKINGSGFCKDDAIRGSVEWLFKQWQRIQSESAITIVHSTTKRKDA